MTDIADLVEALPPSPPTIASIVQQQIDDAQAEATACRAWADQYSARAAAAEARVAQLQALSD
ncbi:hypothetical protein ACIPJ2_16020 [Curtobacterium sp. NPDC090217]|uniref:hypothetical protein n=1 Tax=Curtobacterium sp. NPDC090217 TaxID=3363970 RepID=UPI003815FD69